MSNIEVNEYVRLARNQGINKIIEIEEDGFLILDDFIADEWGDVTDRISPQDIDEEILNHSKNIIDLIEVGDYVNGYPVASMYGCTGVCLNINYQKHGISQIVEIQDIKSIVTWEMMKSVEYRVGE